MQDTRSTEFGKELGNMARSVDEHGKRVWKENEREWREVGRRSGYAVAAIVNIVLLYIANNLLAWNVPFLTAGFVAPLAVISLSLAATVVANITYLVYDPAWFRRLVGLGLNAIAFVATYTLLIVFPFDFGSSSWDGIVRIALVIALVGIAIGTVVELVRFLLGHDQH